MVTMATKRVKRLKLDEAIVKRLEKQNVATCKDVLTKSSLELLKITGVSHKTVNSIVSMASRSCLPKLQTAAELREIGKAFFATSFDQLDGVLHGGLPIASVTEIAGPPGCGKTQTSILLSVLAVLPSDLGGLDGGVIYIDTEGAFSAQRLVEVAQCRFPHYFNTDDKLTDLTNKITIHHVTTCSELLHRLHNLEEEMIRNKVKLVIVDSIASLIRKEYDNSVAGNFIHRSNVLSKQATQLKYLAQSFNIPVVVTNQVTTRVRSFTPDIAAQSNVESLESGAFVTSALGDSWTHSVNTRLILQYASNQQRQIVIAKSPVAQFASVNFVIEDKGPVEVAESMVLHSNGAVPLLGAIKVQSDTEGHQIPYQLH